MTDSNNEVLGRAQLQFAQVKNIAYPDENSPADPFRGVEDSSNGYRTTAETDGFKLTSLHLPRYLRMDIEDRIVLMCHEVAHSGGGGGYNKASHGPDFWDAFVHVVEAIRSTEMTRGLIESVFKTSVGKSIDWHRVIYRAVQHPSDEYVDGRSETVEERKEKLAEAFGYEGYETFETREVYFASGDPDERDMNDPKSVTLSVPQESIRYADEYTDEQLAAFIDEWETDDGYALIPGAIFTVGEHEGGAKESDVRADSWKVVYEQDEWDLTHHEEHSRKVLAVADRLGMTPQGTDSETIEPEDEGLDTIPPDYSPSTTR